MGSRGWLEEFTNGSTGSNLCGGKESRNGEVRFSTLSGFIGGIWVSLAVVGFPVFIGGLFFYKFFITGRIVEKEVFGNDIEIMNCFVKMNEPKRRVVVVNVIHEARLRVHPEVSEPMRGVAKVDGFGSFDLGVHDEIIGVLGVKTGAFSVVSLWRRVRIIG